MKSLISDALYGTNRTQSESFGQAVAELDRAMDAWL